MTRPIRRIAVIGGSHAGLFAGIALTAAGFSVDIYERAPEKLRSRGAGLRIQPLLAETLRRDAGIDLAAASTLTRYDRHIGPGNRIVFEAPEAGQFVSWSSLTSALLAAFDTARYHSGAACVGTTDHGDSIEVRFASGRTIEVDLVVFADGIASTGRRRLVPEARTVYAGYVAWRALVPERDVSRETLALVGDARAFVVAGLSHMPIYPVPGDGENGCALGERLINAIWYRNVREGAELDELMTDGDGFHRPISLRAGSLQLRQIALMRRDAERLLPPAAAGLMLKADPFLQAICDVEPTRMVCGRQVLIGDAAAVTRPHVSASTAKAMRAAWGLAAALKPVAHADAATRTAALAAWEREHLDIARALTDRGRMIGRRLQVDGTFVPGAKELSQITMPASAGAA